MIVGILAVLRSSPNMEKKGLGLGLGLGLRLVLGLG